MSHRAPDRSLRRALFRPARVFRLHRLRLGSHRLRYSVRIDRQTNGTRSAPILVCHQCWDIRRWVFRLRCRLLNQQRIDHLTGDIHSALTLGYLLYLDKRPSRAAYPTRTALLTNDSRKERLIAYLQGLDTRQPPGRRSRRLDSGHKTLNCWRPCPYGKLGRRCQ